MAQSGDVAAFDKQLAETLCNIEIPNRIRFSPDGQKILYSTSLAGGHRKVPITPADNTENIETFVFSPNGEMIVYVSPDEKSEELKEKEQKDEPDPEVWGARWEHARLRLVDVASKEIKILVGGNRHITEIAWSPDGKTVVFLSNENPHIEEVMLTGTSISTVNVETGEVRNLCIVMNELAVYTVDTAAASPNFVKVACGVDDDAVALSVAGGRLLVNRSARLINVISELGGRDLFRKNTAIWAWDVFWNRETDTPALVASLSDVNTPYEVFIIEAGQDDVQLSDHGKPLENQSFGSCTVLTCHSADGEVELDGLYLTPTSKAGQNGTPVEPLPTFVMVHGGPTSRDCDCFDTGPFYWAPYVLSKGYGVLLPQYLGSTGRGEKFASYSMGGQGKYDYADVVSITDNAIKKGFANPQKLMVGGWSQGGLITYLCAVRNGLHGLDWRFNAAIAGAGVCDIESLALTADLGSTYEVELADGDTAWTMSRDDTRNRQGSALWELAGAVERSRRRRETVIPPMLILHGDKDERCPFSQAEGFRRALRAHGLPCEFVAYPGEKHSPKPQRLWLDMLERISRWCGTYIGLANFDGHRGLSVHDSSEGTEGRGELSTSSS
ncbi:hypothetical protein QQZ08_001795 [Neonectria magnoliae]|uniref:Dipeptidyl-peptidase V n=1 Tax=Neonectria magnoliae TaxID=2732573 RepID=A0ABR1ID93_9HYPO